MKNILYICLVFGLLGSCTKIWHTAEEDYTSYRMDSLAVQQTQAQKSIAPYKEILDKEMNKVIAQAKKDLFKGSPESTLGNWMSDVILDKAEELSEVPIDFAMQNSGGIRIPSIAKGEVTKGKIYELMPFENSLIVVHLDRELLMTFLTRIAQSGGWPVSRQFQMEIMNKTPTNVMVKGKLLEDRIYNVALPDYIANGGSDCQFLIGCERTVYPYLLRDMFVEAAESTGEIDAIIEGRITK